MEHESRIDVLIDLKTFHFLKDKSISRMVLFYYDDGTRFTNNRFEKKTRTAQSALLHLATKLPIVRTIATEELAPVPSTWYLPKMAILRHIIYAADSMRISLEQQLFEDRNEFHFIAEVEYDANCTLSSITQKENELTAKVAAFGIAPEIEKVDKHIILNAPSRLFSLFSIDHVNATQFFITYKFDGHKAKMVNIAPGKVLYYDDMKVLKTIETNFLDQYPYLICQFERLAAHLIMTDVIGYFYKNHWYMPEPLEALKFMNSFPFKGTIDGLLFLAQKPINVAQSHDDNSQFIDLKADGYIIYSDNRIYKYKWPTVDVVCHKKQLKLPDGSVVEAATKTRLKDGLLYEVDIGNNNVIRQRNDRSVVHANTIEQINLLRQETEYLKQIHGSAQKHIEDYTR